ncbi:hypothetical protein BD311DRAFT_676434, partial [Dichomitus squalens]
MVVFTSYLLLPLWVALAQSVLVNYTIDDEYGDEVTGVQPAYTPPIYWGQGSDDIPCGLSILQVDTSQVYRQTWHAAIRWQDGQDADITVNFTGSAVYVYHMVANIFPAVDTSSQLSFILDDEAAGQYNNVPDASCSILYNVLVFANTTLENIAHTLIIRGRGTTPLILFDYLVYT